MSDPEPTPEVAAPPTMEEMEDLLGSVWLYISWRYVTKQLTTREKRIFADAVDASSTRLNGEPSVVADRWWDDERQRSYEKPGAGLDGGDSDG